jgi:hypothetical protein
LDQLHIDGRHLNARAGLGDAAIMQRRGDVGEALRPLWMARAGQMTLKSLVQN